jgi:hypothetical protein
MNRRILQGLLWREWLLHRDELTWIFSAWVFGVWVIPFTPAVFMLLFGVVAACLLAPSFGGSDASEGSEEFSFALPPSRAQRYLVRLGLGGGVLMALMVAALLAALFDLPQALWGLLFESTMTVPFAETRPPFVLGLACALAAAIFADAFAAGACCRTPGGTSLLWLRAPILAGIVLGSGLLLEDLLVHGHPTGHIAGIFLGVWTVFRLVRGYRDYEIKEGVIGLPQLRRVRSSAVWIVVVVVVVAVLVLILLFAPGSA